MINPWPAHGIPDSPPHAGAAAGRGDPLDGARDGPGHRHLARLGAADLGGARAAAAPGQDLQALHGPGLRRQAARRGRALCRPAGARDRALDRREVPDPGARPHPAGPADEEGSGRHDDPRLQAQRHHHPVRRAQRARRLGDRPVHAAPPAPGVHPLPQPDRARRPGRQADPRRSWTTTPPTSIPRSAPGSSATTAGPSTSPRPRPPG